MPSGLQIQERITAPPVGARNGPQSTDCIFTVDVEDWFHILQVEGTPPMSAWDQLPQHVETTFSRLLDIFSENDVRVTCFFLAWIAKRHPHLVREAVARGHEIASHGFAHRLVFELSREEFCKDATHSRELLEDIAGRKVAGYRAAGFSVMSRTPWFFDALLESGYEYDSSVFPASRQHGGIRGARCSPHYLSCKSGVIAEFPISVASVLGKNICFFGGGYLRLFPYWLIHRMAAKVRKEDRPVVFYVHPREIDPLHPKLRMSPRRHFKSYVNLHTTEEKVRKLTSEFSLVTFQDYMEQHGDGLPYEYL